MATANKMVTTVVLCMSEVHGRTEAGSELTAQKGGSMAGIKPEDVYSLTGASDPRLSPDGTTVAYVVWAIDRDTNQYTSSIWVAPADGSGEPRRFTYCERRDATPRWSPDGRFLAFTSNRDSEGLQLYAIGAEGGEARRLTDFKGEDVGDPMWSPDGARIAFSVRVRDDAYDESDERRRAPRRFRRLQFKLDNVGFTVDRRSHIFVVSADGSDAPRQVTKGDFEHGSSTWSPDGKQIAFHGARHEDWDIELATDIFVCEVDDGEPRRLTSTYGFASEPSWSPDGTRIAYHYSPDQFDEPRHTRIAVMEATGGDARMLTESLDRTCLPFPLVRAPLWNGDTVLFCVEDHGNTHLYSAAADGSSPPEVLVDGTLGVTGFDAVGETLVYTSSTPTTMSELMRPGGAITSVGKEFSSGRDVVHPERFVATSADGTEVEAWIIKPAGFREGTKYPVLVNIHGGPFTQYANKFFDEFHVYSGGGYAVVYCNPRGSSGYSEEWGRAIRGPVDGGPGWGSVDYDDVMAVTEEAIKRFEFCDGDSVGVMGGSYGGYLTSWIVGHTDRFKAACSERSVNQWVSMYGSSDFGWTFKSYMGVYAHENLQTWIDASPWTYATNINTPLLIMHSENDLRCPIEQAEQLFTTLRLLKKEVEFVRFPAEGHELTRSGNPMHRVQRFEILLEWFDHHLKS